jgi:hypothetical protein
MTLIKHIRLFFFIFLIILLPACKKNEPNSDNRLDKLNCISSFIPKTYDYQVTGFYPPLEAGCYAFSGHQYKTLWYILTRK